MDVSNIIPLNSSKSFSHPSSPNKSSIRKTMSYSELHPDECNETYDHHNGKDEVNRNSASPIAPTSLRQTHITHSHSVASLLALSTTRRGSHGSFIISGCYDDIKVISGTSGGSISAAMCAIKTPEELLRDVCVSNVLTDYLLTGRMKKENIRWIPSLLEMGRNWLESRILVDSSFFKRCCDFYYGDVTFEEAFQMTGKHVCISVSSSRAGSGDTAQRFLLNHISTPHVTISSTVAASCALPGVMKPTKLMAKDSEGNQVVFEVDGVEWSGLMVVCKQICLSRGLQPCSMFQTSLSHKLTFM
jgi:hypothetical protein